MKNITLTLLFSVLLYMASFAQTTFVPDDNFEQALIDLGYDTLLNNFVLTANISSVGILELQNKNISNLQGIEDFAALQELFVDSNNLSNIDLTQNTALTVLSFVNNNLSSLDVSQNTNLTYLDARSNEITDIDVSQNILLQTLGLEDNELTLLNLNANSELIVIDCANNNLGGLSVRNNNNTAIFNFDATGNPGLTCIQVNNVPFANANWLNIDPQTSFNTNCQDELNTYVPDDNFEQELIDLGYDSGVLNDYVLTSNISAVTELELNGSNINDLTGIKDFSALESLICPDNNLTSLDISQNTALESLDCNANELTSLDVSINTALRVLYCNQNQITNLDVSQNTNLLDLQCTLNLITSIDVSQNMAIESLACQGNLITNIDVSENTALTYLGVNYNELTSLDVSNNIALTNLFCKLNAITHLDLILNTNLENIDVSSNQLTSLDVKNGNNLNIISFKAESNPNLTCIEVDDADYSTTNWTDIDAQSFFSEDCDAPQTFVPDDNFEQALIDLGYDSGALDDYVPTSNINDVSMLNIVSQNINDLTGIEDFMALEVLNVDDNNLTGLSVSQNILLTELTCSFNDIASLDLSQNSALVKLIVLLNELTALNVSQNTLLTELFCNSNNITDIDLTQNVALEIFVANDNQLTSLELSQNSNLTVLNCAGNLLTSLNVKNGNNTNVTAFRADSNPNLTCIEVDDAAYSTTNWTDIDEQTSYSEDCDAPQTFVPDNNFEQALINLGYDSGPLNDYVPTANINTITNLNLANQNISDLTGIEDFMALEIFECSNNQITSADMSQNTALTYLNFNTNSLGDLDISQNTALTFLSVSENQLTTLDISANILLVHCFAGNNQLNILNTSQNTLLEILLVNNNQLLSIVGLNQNTSLETLQLTDNQITLIDLSLNGNLDVVEVDGNNLSSLNLQNGNNANISFFDVRNNPNLDCIAVDDPSYSNSNWTNIDPQTSFSENCDGIDCDTSQTIQVTSTVNTIEFDLSNEIINGANCGGTSPQDFADTWFEFVMPENGSVGINGQVDYNRFALYDVCGGAEIDCFANQGVVHNLIAGTAYKLRVFRDDDTKDNPNFTSFNIIYQNTLGLVTNTVSNTTVTLFPNPASSLVSINVPNDKSIEQIAVYDISGKHLVTQNNQNTINISALSNGIYFVNIHIDRQAVTKKLIIKK